MYGFLLLCNYSSCILADIATGKLFPFPYHCVKILNPSHTQPYPGPPGRFISNVTVPLEPTYLVSYYCVIVTTCLAVIATLKIFFYLL